MIINIILIIITAIVTSISYKERFTINDYYSRYFNDIAVPVGMYSQSSYAQGLKMVEMNDRFFMDTLNKSKNPSRSFVGGETPQVQPTERTLNLTNKFIEKILNAALPPNTPTLFAVRHGSIRDMRRKDNVLYVVSDHVVYREGKIYGAALRLKTVHDNDTIDLVDFSLVGFIYQDKIIDTMPSNLETSTYQSYMLDQSITKDAKYEKDYLCQYFRDLEKFRGIKVNTNIKCD
jgi:hypothetical protein